MDAKQAVQAMQYAMQAARSFQARSNTEVIPSQIFMETFQIESFSYES
jgi:hypothetical protein